MKRRDAFRLVPLTIAGMTAAVARAAGGGLTVPWEHDSSRPLALRYTAKVSEMIRTIRDTQAAGLMEAAWRIARTVRSGGTVWSGWDSGHNPNYDFAPERNAVPEMFTINYDDAAAEKGDVYLTAFTRADLRAAREKGVYVVGSTSPYSLDGEGGLQMRNDLSEWRFKPHCNLWIDLGISRYGAVMEVPGSKFPIGPVSGILGMTTFWMMMADACRFLAIEGVSVPVRGDEPVITGLDAPDWEPNHIRSLDRPLMIEYADRILEDIALIEAEMGRIRAAADATVDAVLAGGRVYCYSRYRNQLAVEGTTRRGGLALFNGIYDGVDGRDFEYVHEDYREPFTGEDIVFMGFTRPDDPVDLDNLDRFRAAGMTVVSIGPQGRDFKVPAGRTVPKESDIHLGAMSDTYGVFALPGFERKVCPTSGATNNQLYWAAVMEIVERFMARTGGDVPGIHANVAIRSGRRNMRWNLELYRQRGY